MSFRWPTKSTTERITTQITSTTSVTTKKPKTNVIIQDIRSFLPPGYELKKEDAAVTESSLLSDILAKSKVDISSLLPADYEKKKNEGNSKNKIITTTAKNLDVSAEKSIVDIKIQDLFAKSKFDISSFVPRDYEQKIKNFSLETKDVHTENASKFNISTTTESTSTTIKSKFVFPSSLSRTGKPIHKITTSPKPRTDILVTPKIRTGWPTR